MAFVNAANSYVAVGNSDDINNVIVNIAPSETPILSSAGRGRAVGILHSWIEDELRRPGANAVAEGADYVVQAPKPRKMRANVTQIMTAGYAVTGTQEKVAKHGVKSELAYQMQKATKELALDHEWALINNTGAVPGGTLSIGGNPTGSPAIAGWGSSTNIPTTVTPDPIYGTIPAGAATDMIRKFKGIPEFIESNIISGAFDEENLNLAIQDAWMAGGNPKRAYMSATNKREASKWPGNTQGRTVRMEQSDKKFMAVVRFYESDFGVVEMLPHRMMPENLILILDPAYVKLADLRPVHRETIAKTADAVNGVLLGETTLEVKAEAAHAKIIVAP